MKLYSTPPSRDLGTAEKAGLRANSARRLVVGRRASGPRPSQSYSVQPLLPLADRESFSIESGSLLDSKALYQQL